MLERALSDLPQGAEDGVSLWPGKGPLEHREVDQLINLLSDVLATRANGLARVPVAPTHLPF